MTTAKLKPAPGCRVRYPDNPQLILSDEGDQVVLTSAWRRLIKAGDVLEVEPPPPPEGGEGGETRRAPPGGAAPAEPAPEGVEGVTKPATARPFKRNGGDE
jgi:hypothetical protein